MDPRLDRLITAFNQAQAHVVVVLDGQLGIRRPSSNTEWTGWHRLVWDKAAAAGLFLKPHGYGLAFKDERWQIDFDFGNAGEIDGFDVHRLFSFDRNNGRIGGFTDVGELKAALMQAEHDGELVFSGYINYYRTRR